MNEPTTPNLIIIIILIDVFIYYLRRYLRIYHETASVRDCYAVKLFVFKSYRYE